MRLEGSWWGGRRELETTDEGTALKFACATGTIDMPLPPVGAGDCTGPGTFTPGQGVPFGKIIRLSPDPPSARRACVATA